MGISYTKIIVKFICILFCLSIFLGVNYCYAALPTGLDNAFSNAANSPLDAVAVQGGGFNTKTTYETMVSAVISLALRLMGVIFLILAIYGGYTWMMARGNEEQVEKAKKTITNAVVGLIIVLAAYAMVWLVVDVIGGKVFTPTVQAP